ncbi:LysR family transcriptional regulator [Vibrio hepatarius]|uniref:LysR family transcriptional regulator n=1 Tax=Vibrio hepatarius TaxID=171383 RepID=UPI001C081698|nr:LysR family transcriptional regulator [Vibrio hepatarius]MBU2899365.1 LysR family transcriptional regulator [Vibrio hepatarius]
MLNPIWLNTFKTLIEVGHFTRTAETLHMTQPGVTQHISKLEHACGYPLLKRFNKQFELTLYGQKVYHYALDYFANEARLLQNLGQDEAFKGRCTIGCSGTLAWLLYSPLLDLQARYPDLSIELEATPNECIFEQIKQGTLDLGLVTKKPDSKYFSSQNIGAERLELVVPECTKMDSPLDNLLKDLGIIRHPDLAHYFQTYIAQSNHTQLNLLNLDEIKTQSYINQIHQILEPITRGIGFTVVPSWCINLFNGRHKLKVIEIEKEVLEPIYLVSKLNTSLGKRYNQVIAVIEKTLSASK